MSKCSEYPQLAMHAREFAPDNTSTGKLNECQVIISLLFIAVQGSVERGMDAPNGLIGEPFTIELCSKEPTVLFEFRIELLNVVGGQLVHLNISQHRDDVLINAPLI